nr:helix-turn-helix transcriptional regulator [Poseidonocella sp. HB161398]
MPAEPEDHDSIARQVGAASLRALREDTGMSQSQLAEALDLSERALRRYERGERALPLRTRIAFIQRFRVDPLPGGALAARLGLGSADLSPVPHARTAAAESFWKGLRHEGREFRLRNYSPVGQVALKIRDCAYLAATTYFTMKHVALALGLPSGFESGGTDWIFLASAGVILLLFSSFTAELPLLKIARHLLKRKSAQG